MSEPYRDDDYGIDMETERPTYDDDIEAEPLVSRTVHASTVTSTSTTVASRNPGVATCGWMMVLIWIPALLLYFRKAEFSYFLPDVDTGGAVDDRSEFSSILDLPSGISQVPQPVDPEDEPIVKDLVYINPVVEEPDDFEDDPENQWNDTDVNSMERWGAWKFYDGNEDLRPTNDYCGKYPNRWVN